MWQKESNTIFPVFLSNCLEFHSEILHLTKN